MLGREEIDTDDLVGAEFGALSEGLPAKFHAIHNLLSRTKSLSWARVGLEG